MWDPLGSAEAATATYGASETICQKLETCGVLQKIDVPKYDYNETRQGLTANISSAIYAQVSFGSSSSSDSPMSMCIEQVKGGIDEADEAVDMPIPWAALATCLAQAPCSAFSDFKVIEQHLLNCAREIGINVPIPDQKTTTPQYPPDYTPPNNNTGSDVCEKAADKILDCMKSLDCSTFEEVMQPACESAKDANYSRPETCEGSDKTKAEEILDCTLDEQKFCLGCK